jgi:hypothetical protein
VSVFLRWGILGILGVAGLLYVYNASKRISEARATRPVSSTSSSVPGPASAPAPAESSTAACELELQVAMRARDIRRQSEPMDRLLRIQEIAWQESAERRERLEKVARRWYDYPGPIGAAALRTAVISDCEQFTPVP